MSKQSSSNGVADPYNWADITDDDEPPTFVRADCLVGNIWDNGSRNGANDTEDKESHCKDCGRKLACRNCPVGNTCDNN